MPPGGKLPDEEIAVLRDWISAGAPWPESAPGAAAPSWWAFQKVLPQRPNVLLVTIDTLRADHVGCYGYKAASTPTIDALAGRGVRFETAVARIRSGKVAGKVLARIFH